MQLVLIAGEGRDVGKTLLGERLVAVLREKGLRVGVVKHVHHGVDYRVKDTGRYLGAGAERVVAVGPSEYMLVEKKRLGFWEAIQLLNSSDAAIVEGFREHIDSVIEKGGCTAYIHRDGTIDINPGNRKANNIDEALEVLTELVAAKKCTIMT